MKNRLIFLFLVVILSHLVFASVMINEINVDPKTDWDENGIVSSADEWFELYNDGLSDVNLSGWNLSLMDTTNAVEILSGIISSGSYFTVINPTGTQNNDGRIILRDNNGAEIDSVTYGNYNDGNATDNAPDGNSNNINDECLARTPNGANTNIDKNDFIKTICTFNSTNFLNATQNISENITITNKSSPTGCVFKGNNFTLSAIVTGSCVEEVIFSVLLDDDWKNYSGVNVGGDKYRIVLNSNSFNNSGIINWTVFGRNCLNQTKQDGYENFYLTNRTLLSINPSSPDGLNGWYISKPTFSLSNNDAVNRWYRWNGIGESYYSGSFGLEGAPDNAEETGIKIILKYRSDACGNEPVQEKTLLIDLLNPLIKNLNPENNSKINSPSVISADISNQIGLLSSGINKSSVVMKVDGIEVPANISEESNLDLHVNYFPENISEDSHTIYLNATDNAGRYGEMEWTFEILQKENFSMNVYSLDKTFYGDKRIVLNISLSKKVDELKYLDSSSSGWKKLCNNCDEYGFKTKKTKIFRDGEHNVTIRAGDFGDSHEENFSFVVDSKKPQISLTKPSRGEYTNGNDFYIKFREENVVNLTLTIKGNETQTFELDKNCSENGNYKECYNDLNLSSFDGQEVKYWFNVTDVVRSADSKQIEIDIDTTAPIVNYLNYSISGRYVNFILNVTETNLDKITYSYTDAKGKFKSGNLCIQLRNGVCEKKKHFSSGDYNATIIVLDKAGNNVGVPISFVVD